jgi:hypothetical protein
MSDPPSPLVAQTQSQGTGGTWPRAAAGLSVFGGFWIVVGGALFTYFTLKLTPSSPYLYEPVVEVLCGAIVLGLGYWLRLQPGHHFESGMVIILACVASLFFPPAGGFLFGALIGLAGGILGILWKSPARESGLPQVVRP